MLVQFNKVNKFIFENSLEPNLGWEVFVDSFHNASIASTPKINLNLMNLEDKIAKIKK